MGLKGKICVVFLVFAAVFLVSTTVSVGLSDRDPEIGVCKIKCEEIRGVDQDVQLKCKQGCEKYYQEKQKREREGGQGRGTSHGGRSGGRGGSGGGGGGQYDILFAQEAQDVQRMVGECHQICQGSQGEQQHPQCFQSCMQKRFQQHGQQRQTGETSRPERTRRGGKQRQQQQSNNPYVFEDHHFTTRQESQQGNVKVLQKFTDRNSELFRGIEKYRVALLEAEPQTFVIPNHWDADALFFVANGEGTITLINKQDSRQSHNIKRGDIFRVPAGINAYLINRHNNERLVLAKILRSISVPGELQTFFSAGGDNPESSFFNAFSTEVLEAAFDTDRDSVERLFGQQQLQQQQGIFKKATEEQIRSLTGEKEGGIWPFGERKGKGKGPYNIYEKTPSVANENGILHEVDSDDFNDLENIKVAFSFYNISQGSMAGPFYHTKATMALVVINGGGQFEMACPHLSEQASGGGFNPTYQKVSSELRRGTVVVIPAGHPIVIEASGDQNLEAVGFGLNTDENEWFPLAGRDNVMSQWEDEAVELTFGAPAREVQRVIQKQNKRLFFNGPVRRGRAFA